MPSDPRIEALPALLTGASERWRTTVAGAAEQMAEFLDRHRASGGVPAGRLGRFAAGRISEARFTALFEPDALVPGHVEPVERAAAVLREVLAQDIAAPVPLPRGGELVRLVDDQLARAGRAFGAALLFQAVRAGIYRPEQHDRLLEGLPFARWNRAERDLAPPVVVLVDGADLRADGLAAFLDGGVKLVLVVDAPCPPAALVRLITPGVFVMQTGDPSDLARLLAAPGPGVAALVPDGAARFAHDPAGGPALADRLTVAEQPEPAKAALSGRSAWQQHDELAQLALLAGLAAPVGPVTPEAGSDRRPATVAAPSAGASTPESSVDTFAAWLLAQAGFGSGAAPSP